MKNISILLSIVAFMLSGLSVASEPTKPQRCDTLAYIAYSAMTNRQVELDIDFALGQIDSSLEKVASQSKLTAIIRSAYKYDIEQEPAKKLDLINAYKDIVYTDCMEQSL